MRKAKPGSRVYARSSARLQTVEQLCDDPAGLSLWSQAMHRAFEAVCAKLQLSMASEDRMTELAAEKIIELAQASDHGFWRFTQGDLEK
jgi:hypothetical protein